MYQAKHSNPAGYYFGERPHDASDARPPKVCRCEGKTPDLPADDGLPARCVKCGKVKP